MPTATPKLIARKMAMFAAIILVHKRFDRPISLEDVREASEVAKFRSYYKTDDTFAAAVWELHQRENFTRVRQGIYTFAPGFEFDHKAAGERHEKLGLTLLGRSGVNTPGEHLEAFKRPKNIERVVMTSDEVTALCPVTGQPDQYTVEIAYYPKGKCIESKALKLKLQSYRQVGVFCEQLASDLVDHVHESIHPDMLTVKVTQKPRGGVSIVATARRDA